MSKDWEPVDLSEEFGEFARLVELRIMFDRLPPRFCEKAMFILPPDLLAGATAAYGLPIVRADVDGPMLGLRAAP